ncbi:MAG: RidA family protein [Oscillospiraceae bacterium]|nr:RidA family protein [Oscillospiraceae bacterium]
MEKIFTEQAPSAIGPYSQAIKTNGMVYTSGQIAIVPATGNIESDTIQGQTEQVMQNLQHVLKASGSDFSKVVKTTCFLANISDFGAFNEIYGKYITEKPVRSCVAVKDLPKGALVEVEVIAIAE